MQFFGKCRDGKIRVFKVSIENGNLLNSFLLKPREMFIIIFLLEELTLSDHKNSKGTWDKDFDSCVLPLVKEQQPCYLLYRYCKNMIKICLIYSHLLSDDDFRLDTKSGTNYDWVLIFWSPEDSPVRQKMLYASTKATLKQEFGGSQITEELFGTSKDDISLQGFKNHQVNSKAPAPLTFREEELLELKRNEGTSTDGVNARQQTLQSVAFPVAPGAKKAIQLLAQGKYNYLRLRIGKLSK